MQELPSNYNKERMGVRTLKSCGMCSWSKDFSHERRIGFEREGYKVKQSCMPRDGAIAHGAALYSDSCDEQLTDTYYQAGLAVFDPKDFKACAPQTSKSPTMAPRLPRSES